jgi:hypothetical protein
LVKARSELVNQNAPGTVSRRHLLRRHAPDPLTSEEARDGVRLTNLDQPLVQSTGFAQSIAH